tara:strand:- start:6573 stop:6944 length:372 start_codon:yes stop_codon:yes gene_type:complete
MSLAASCWALKLRRDPTVDVRNDAVDRAVVRLEVVAAVIPNVDAAAVALAPRAAAPTPIPAADMPAAAAVVAARAVELAPRAAAPTPIPAADMPAAAAAVVAAAPEAANGAAARRGKHILFLR